MTVYVCGRWSSSWAPKTQGTVSANQRCYGGDKVTDDLKSDVADQVYIVMACVAMAYAVMAYTWHIPHDLYDYGLYIIMTCIVTAYIQVWPI